MATFTRAELEEKKRKAREAAAAVAQPAVTMTRAQLLAKKAEADAARAGTVAQQVSPRGNTLQIPQVNAIRRETTGKFPYSQEESQALPEQSHAMTGGVMSDLGVGVARTFLYPEDYAQVALQAAQKINPKASLMQDEAGDFILDVSGEGDLRNMTRLNAAGISPTDIMNISGDIAGMGGLAKGITKAGGKVIGEGFEALARTAKGQAAGAASYSVGKDIAGNMAGEDQELEVVRPVSEGLMAGGMQKVAEWVTAPVSRWWDKRKTANTIKEEISGLATGQLADSARIALEKANYPTGGLTTQEVAELNNALLRYPNLKEAELGRAIAKDVLMGSTPTAGFVTQDPQDLMREELARAAGASGGKVTEQIRQATIEDPERFINSVVDPLDARTRGEVPLAGTQDTLSTMKQGERAVFDQRFDTFRDMANAEVVTPQQIQGVRNGVYGEVRSKVGAQTAGKIAGVKPDAKEPAFEGIEDMGYPPAVKPPEPAPIPKRPKNPRLELPKKPTMPENLKGKGKELQRESWKQKNEADHAAAVKAARDAHDAQVAQIDADHMKAVSDVRNANKLAAQQAKDATAAQNQAADDAYNQELAMAEAQHQSVLDDFNANPQETDRVGGMFPAQTTGTDKRLTPGDILAWTEDISADRNLVGGQIAANAAREALRDMALDDALGASKDGVLNYMITHQEYRGFLEQWDPKRLMGKIVDADNGRLIVEPNKVADTLFGGQASGFLSKNGATTAVKDLRSTLSRDEWIPVRQELIYRLLGGGISRPAKSGMRSADMMKRHFEEARRTHSDDYIREILDDGTGNGQEMLDYYARSLGMFKDTATAPGKGSKLNSDTTRGMLEAFSESRTRIPGRNWASSGTNTFLDALRGTVGKGVDIAQERAAQNANALLLDPNKRAYQPPPPWRAGLLSQLYNEE